MPERFVPAKRDTLRTLEVPSARRTAVILHIEDPKSLRGRGNLPMIPAAVSYDTVGALLRGEVAGSARLIEFQRRSRRGLSEMVVGRELNPPFPGNHPVVELSTRRILRDRDPAKIDKTPTLHVDPNPYLNHAEMIYVSEGNELQLVVPRTSEQVEPYQLISTGNLDMFTLHPGDLVALSAVPYALIPVGGEAKYQYISTDSHLRYPNYEDRPVHPIEILGRQEGTDSQLLYVAGDHHPGLVAARVEGLSGPETVVAQSIYPTLRAMTSYELYDMRTSGPSLKPLTGGVTVFSKSV